MTYYQSRNEDARAQAQDWQRRVYSDPADPITYGELVAAQDYFYRLGCRYGLIREYRENGII